MSREPPILDASRTRFRTPPVFVIGVAAAVVSVAIVWFSWPPAQHTARSLVHVAHAPPKILLDVSENKNVETYRSSLAALVKSRFVLNTALGKSDVQHLRLVMERPDPVQWLENEIKVDFSAGPEVLRISLQGDEPRELAILVNAVTRAYLDEIASKEQNQKVNRLEVLRTLHRKYDEKIQARKQNMRDLTKAAASGTSFSWQLQQKLASKQLDLAMTELLQVNSELRKLQAKIAVRLAKDSAMREFAILFCACPSFASPVNVALAGMLAPSGLREEKTVSQPAESLALLREKQAFMRQLEKILAHDVERLASDNRPLNEPTLDLEILADDIRRWESQSSKIAHEIDTLEVERFAPMRVSLLENAVVYPAENDPQRLWLAGSVGLGALALVLLGPPLWRWRCRRVAG